ncbi:hypothetical protein [Cardinium endosymbiont of Philonthus spinipes]|uniref:hypothetical protein n=1 Tax=Cardinium endosymbiont of Philonthus spinipes TaxID=3077941 RepID=UPI00313DB4CA
MYSKKICLLPLMMLGGCRHTMPQPVNDNLNPDEVKETASGIDVPRSDSTPLKEITIQSIMDCAEHTNILLNSNRSQDPYELFVRAMRTKFYFLPAKVVSGCIKSIKKEWINGLVHSIDLNEDQARLYARYITETIIDITIHKE